MAANYEKDDQNTEAKTSAPETSGIAAQIYNIKKKRTTPPVDTLREGRT